MRRIGCALVCLSVLLASLAGADEAHQGARPDAHAPLGVMGDHMHKAGEYMLSYRFMLMHMNGNRDGTRDLGAQDVLSQGYLATPTDMDMEMHMFGLMYAPADWVTLTAMFPYVRMWMNHVNAMGRFETKSEGPGDLALGGLLRLWENETHHLHANLAVSFPTGPIRRKDWTPVPGMGFMETTLPFPMQIGSGTFDLLPGLTYTGRSRHFSWGAQARGAIRLEKNDAGWARGNEAAVTAWAAHPWNAWVSTSIRAAYRYAGNYRGDESRPPTPQMIPTADPDRRAYQRIDLMGGLNLVLPLGPLGEHRFAIEMGGPVYQWLDGPQLKTNWQLVVGWQKAF